MKINLAMAFTLVTLLCADNALAQRQDLAAAAQHTAAVYPFAVNPRISSYLGPSYPAGRKCV